MKKCNVPIGQLYAVLDHFEQTTHQPIRSSALCKVLPKLTRTDLRLLERKGRLMVFYLRTQTGSLEKGYLRPREVVATDEQGTAGSAELAGETVAG